MARIADTGTWITGSDPLRNSPKSSRSNETDFLGRSFCLGRLVVLLRQDSHLVKKRHQLRLSMCARFVERGPDQASIYDLQIGPEHFHGKFVSRYNLPLPIDDKGRSTQLASTSQTPFGLTVPSAIPFQFLHRSAHTYLYL